MIGSSKDGDAEDFEEPTRNAPAASQTATGKGKRSPSPRNCREFIRRETADAMLDIVTTFVEKAKEGSVPHFTSLTKVGGFDQRSGPAEAPKKRRRSLARQLLDEVEQYEARQAAALAANKATSPVTGPQPDTSVVQERS